MYGELDTPDVDQPDINDLGAQLKQIQAGSEPALEQFYAGTVDRVYALAARILGRGPDAEEITEDVYLYVWTNAERYDAGLGRPLSWLLTLVRSRAIDRWRYNARQKRLGEALASEPQAEALEPGLDVLFGQTRLHRCLAALPQVQRQVLALAYFRGMSHSEIAAELQMSLGTVKTHIRRTLVSLRAEMNQ